MCYTYYIGTIKRNRTEGIQWGIIVYEVAVQRVRVSIHTLCMYVLQIFQWQEGSKRMYYNVNCTVRSRYVEPVQYTYPVFIKWNCKLFCKRAKPYRQCILLLQSDFEFILLK